MGKQEEKRKQEIEDIKKRGKDDFEKLEEEVRIIRMENQQKLDAKTKEFEELLFKMKEQMQSTGTFNELWDVICKLTGRALDAVGLQNWRFP